MKEVNYPSYGNGKTIFSPESLRQAFLKIICTLAIALPCSVFASTSGDVNGDGSVTIADYELLDQIILGYSSPTAASDVNGDGKTDVLDITYVKNILSGATNEITATAAPISVKIASINKETLTMEIRAEGSGSIKGCQIDLGGVKVKSIESAYSGAVARYNDSRLLLYSETAMPASDMMLAVVKYEVMGTEACITQRTMSGEKAQAIPGHSTTPAGDICRDITQGGVTGSVGVSINIDKAVPHSSAMLDVTSINKGILIPRMTSSQRIAIASPAASLLVYDTDMLSFYFYCSHGWTKISSGESGWGITGNSGINPVNNFIGTTDAQDLAFRANNIEQLRITSGGNIGVGTTTPKEKLHIIGTAKADIFRLGDTGANGVYWDFQEEANNDLSVKYGTYGEYLRIKYDNGFFGIGNPNPKEKLDITGNFHNTGEIYSDGQRSKIRFHYENLSELPDATQYHGMFAHVHDQNSAYFSHAGNWLRILNEDASGNAGIGTSTPLSKLHIKGGSGNYLLVESAAAETNFEIKSDGRVQVGAQNDDARFFASENVGFASTIKAKGTGNTNAIYGYGEATVTGVRGESIDGKGVFGLSNSGNAGHFQSNTGNTLLLENTTDNVALIIPSGKGKAGIGTNIPTSRLHISSGTGFDQLRLESGCTDCPTGSADSRGNTGDIVWGVSGSGNSQSYYIYIKTPQGWQRAKLNNF